MIKQANFRYSLLGKAFEQQIKNQRDQGVKQFETLKALKSDENTQDTKSFDSILPKQTRTNKIKNEINEIKKMERKNQKKRFKTHI